MKKIKNKNKTNGKYSKVKLLVKTNISNGHFHVTQKMVLN